MIPFSKVLQVTSMKEKETEEANIYLRGECQSLEVIIEKKPWEVWRTEVYFYNFHNCYYWTWGKIIWNKNPASF